MHASCYGIVPTMTHWRDLHGFENCSITLRMRSAGLLTECKCSEWITLVFGAELSRSSQDGKTYPRPRDRRLSRKTRAAVGKPSGPPLRYPLSAVLTDLRQTTCQSGSRKRSQQRLLLQSA